MKNWCWVREDILRIIIPYKDIDTTVFVLRSPEGLLLFDTAGSDADINTYLLPLMQELELPVQDLRYIFISHNHRDHAGGLGCMTAAAPQAVIVTGNPDLKAEYGERVLVPEDGRMLLNRFRVVKIPGHTADSAALLDIQTNTLITGDCLQMFGIYGSGQWGANISFPAEHLQAIEKIRGLQVENLLCAHIYHPFGREVQGATNVNRALDACVEPLMRLRRLIMNHPGMDDEGICEKYHQDEYLPAVSGKVVAALRRALQEGSIV